MVSLFRGYLFVKRRLVNECSGRDGSRKTISDSDIPIINKLMQGPSAMPWRMDSTLTYDREDFLTRNAVLRDKH
jgi:hypothetical protein